MCTNSPAARRAVFLLYTEFNDPLYLSSCCQSSMSRLCPSHLCSFIFAYAHFISVCSSVCSRRQFSSFLPVFWFQTVFPSSHKAAAHSILNKQKTAELRAFCPFSTVLAEKEGFEPSRQSPQPTPLAGEPLTATWVLLHGLY